METNNNNNNMSRPEELEPQELNEGHWEETTVEDDGLSDGCLGMIVVMIATTIGALFVILR